MENCNHHKKKRISNCHFRQIEKSIERREFLTKTSLGLGAIALGNLLGINPLSASSSLQVNPEIQPPFSNPIIPKAKRVIYLFQSGGPSQQDLFDYKPDLHSLRGSELPDSIRQGMPC